MAIRPRLLPVVMLAASALLAVKLIDLWEGGSAAIAATLGQETQSAKPLAAAADPPAASDKPGGPPPAPPPATPAPNAAKRDPLQMSPEEISELQQLSARRIELDKRAGELSEREVLMKAAEKRLDEKIAKLQAIEKAIEGSVKQRNDEEDARVQSL